jgi:hypothetical protein
MVGAIALENTDRVGGAMRPVTCEPKHLHSISPTVSKGTLGGLTRTRRTPLEPWGTWFPQRSSI